MSACQTIRTYVDHVQCVLESDLDESIKSRAFEISRKPISRLVKEVIGNAELVCRWSELKKSWGTMQSSDKKVARLSLVLDAIKQPKGAASSSASLFQKNGNTMRSLHSRLRNLQSVFDQETQPDKTKMTLFNALEPTISFLIDGLNGQPECIDKWRALRTAQKEVTQKEVTRALFIQRCREQLPAFIKHIEAEIERLDRLHSVVDTPKKTSQDCPWLQREDLRTLLVQSLPEKTKEQCLAWPHTFCAIDMLVLHILHGDYGIPIREHLLAHGFFAQEHLLVLLLVDLARDKRSIAAVEIFCNVPQDTLELVQCTDLDSDTISNWISVDDAVLPAECFIEAIANARLEDEKQFSRLREYARLRYAPSPETLLYLILHANEPSLLQSIEELVEKEIASLLHQAYTLVLYPNDKTMPDALEGILDTIDDEGVKREWFDTIILGLAENDGPLAIAIARDFLDGTDLDETQGSIIATYGQRHYEEASALLTLLPVEQQQPILLSIIAFHAQNNPQYALSILEKTPINPELVPKVLSSIAKPMCFLLEKNMFLELLEGVSATWKVPLCAAMALHLAKTSDLSFGHRQMWSYVPTEGSELVIFMIYYHHTDTVSLQHAFSYFIKELGSEHTDLIRTGMMLHVRFATTNAPEAFEEEISMLAAICDPSLLGRALTSYLLDTRMLMPHEFNQSCADEQRRRIQYLVPLIEKTRKEACFDWLQHLLCCLATDCDKKLMVALLSNINDPILRKRALKKALKQLKRLVAHAVQAEFRGIPQVPHDIYDTLPEYLEKLDLLVTTYAEDDPPLLTELQILLADIWAPFSSKQAIRLVAGLPIKDPKELVTAVRSIAVGHFSQNNHDRGALTSLHTILPKAGRTHYEREYMVAIRRLLRRGCGVNDEIMELAHLIETSETRAVALSSIVSHLCTTGQFTPKWAGRVTEALDPEQREAMLERLLHELRRFVRLSLQGEEEGEHPSTTGADIQPLSQSLHALYGLVESWTAGKGPWRRLLALLYAHFASAQAITLLKCAEVEAPEITRSALQYIARNFFSKYNTERDAIDTILEWLFQDMLENADIIATIAGGLISDDERIETALAALKKLLHDPCVKIVGPLEATLTSCLQGLRKYNPEYSLQLFQGGRATRFLVKSVIADTIPGLLHSGQLNPEHVSIICGFAKQCQSDDADNLYGSLAYACACGSLLTESTKLFVSMIENEQAKHEWNEIVNIVLDYKVFCRKGLLKTEALLGDFAITIAPYLFKEALDIATKLTDPHRAIQILSKVSETATAAGADWVIYRYYMHELNTIINRIRSQLPSLAARISLPPLHKKRGE